MRIRITGRGLPKAQWQNSEVDDNAALKNAYANSIGNGLFQAGLNWAPVVNNITGGTSAKQPAQSKPVKASQASQPITQPLQPITDITERQPITFDASALDQSQPGTKVQTQAYNPLNFPSLNLRRKGHNWNTFKSSAQNWSNKVDQAGENAWNQIKGGVAKGFQQVKNQFTHVDSPNVGCPPGYTRDSSGICREPSLGIGPDDSVEYMDEQLAKRNASGFKEASDLSLQKSDADFGNALVEQQGLFKFGKRKELKDFAAAYNQRYDPDDQERDYKATTFGGDLLRASGKTAKGIFNGIKNSRDNIAGIGATALQGVGMVDMYTQMRDNRQKQLDWNNSFIDSQFQTAGVPAFRGNFNNNTGMFQQDRIFNPNEGLTAEEGGEMNTPMKIRITSMPGEQHMAYGGQTQYGLDLNRRSSQTEPRQSSFGSVSNTMTAVPREMANIEAEGGETILGDTDGDGVNEHYVIKGERHTNGGVPLNVPEGSFVFSDTKKMRIKDSQILKVFGLTPRPFGYTPAEIAKRYDINKYKAILENPDEDELSKSTAQLMVKNYQDKLAKLAVIQESMKGMPGGIPKVASEKDFGSEDNPEMAYGGSLPKYQGTTGASTTGTTQTAGIPRMTVKKEEIPNYEKEGWTRKQGVDNVWEKRSKTTLTGDYKPGESSGTPGGKFGPAKKTSQLTKDPCAYIGNLAAKGMTAEEFVQKGYGTAEGLAKYKDCFDRNFKPTSQETPGLCLNDQGQPDPSFKYNPETKKCEKIDETVRELTYEEQPTIGHKCLGLNKDGTPNMTSQQFKSAEERSIAGFHADAGTAKQFCAQKPQKENFKAMLPDRLNMFDYPVKKYMPYSPDLTFKPRQLALEDWQAQAQNVQQNFNSAAGTLGNFQPGQALASNLSYMAGQAADNIGQAIAGTTGRNVDRYNQFNLQETQRKDAVDQYNVANRTSLWDKNVTANQQYDNAMRNQLNNAKLAYANLWNNRMKLGMLNSVNPYYKIDPTSGRTFFTQQGKNAYDFPNGMTASSGGTGVYNVEKYKQLPELTRQIMAASGLSKEKAEEEAMKMMRGSGSASVSDMNNDGIPDRTSMSGPLQQMQSMVPNYSMLHAPGMLSYPPSMGYYPSGGVGYKRGGTVRLKPMKFSFKLR